MCNLILIIMKRRISSPLLIMGHMLKERAPLGTLIDSRNFVHACISISVSSSTKKSYGELFCIWNLSSRQSRLNASFGCGTLMNNCDYVRNPCA